MFNYNSIKMTTSLYMTTANTHISTKVIAVRFETYFKIKVSKIEYVFTCDNYHYTVYFNRPLPVKYMESLKFQKVHYPGVYMRMTIMNIATNFLVT